MAKICGLMMLFLLGCSTAVESTPNQKHVDVEAFLSSVDTQARALATALAAQKLTGELTLENTQSIIKKLNTLEASLVVPKVEPGKEVIKSAPESPANANTQQAHLKVATPGTSQPETLVQLATRLYAQGVNTNMKTREELEAIDAQLQGVKPKTVQYQMRPSYQQSWGTVCVNGQCFVPQASRRRR